MTTSKTCLITGASSGIGYCAAEVFAENGYDLFIAARRVERLEDLAVRLRQKDGIKCRVICLDVASVSNVQSQLRDVPGVDVLINNAGLALGLESMHEADVANWEQMIDTNISGLLYVTRTILPKMLERKTGRVINVGSISGQDTYAKGSVYCATKAAVEAITNCLRRELLGTGLSACCIKPGSLETEFAAVRFKGDMERASAVYAGIQKPLTPRDVAEAIYWMASRPPNVNVSDLTIMSVDQAANAAVHRVS